MAYKATIETIREHYKAYGECWWVFSAYNSQPYYGFGSDAEAVAYADILNRGRQVNVYAGDIADDETALRLESGEDSDGFRLDLALDTQREIDEWQQRANG